MRHPFFLVLFTTLVLLGGCNSLPGLDDSPAVLPTRLILPTATEAAPHSAAAPANTTVPGEPIPYFAWFANPDDRAVLGVNPQNQQIMTKILTTFNPGLVTSFGDDVWVTQNVDEKITSLLHLKRQSSAISDDIPIQYGQATSISAAGDYVWLTLQSPDSAAGELKGGVVQVDINQQKLLRYIETRGYPLQVSATAQAAWVLVQDALTTHFERINPANGESSLIPPSVQSSGDLQLFERFSIQSSGLWATPRQHTPYVFQVDPQTGKIINIIKVGSTPAEHPIDITAGAQSVYAALQNNTILAIDPAAGTISTPVTINAQIDRLSIVDNTIWVWSHTAATAYQVDNHSNRILGSTQLGSTPIPTPTIPVYPTPSIMGGSFKPCDGLDFESNLRTGMKAIVNPDPPLPDRVRISASRTGKIVDIVNPNHWMDILEGPACVEGKVWWKVRTQNNIIGWTMEGDGIDHWLLPAPENK
jgi:hypothetical protein